MAVAKVSEISATSSKSFEDAMHCYELNAAADSGPMESFALAMGSGAGFALALFLMSCARERLELARVPASFEGLPIAFALAGLFALAFMGFSGLDFFR